MALALSTQTFKQGEKVFGCKFRQVILRRRGKKISNLNASSKHALPSSTHLTASASPTFQRPMASDTDASPKFDAKTENQSVDFFGDITSASSERRISAADVAERNDVSADLFSGLKEVDEIAEVSILSKHRFFNL